MALPERSHCAIWLASWHVEIEVIARLGAVQLDSLRSPLLSRSDRWRIRLVHPGVYINGLSPAITLIFGWQEAPVKYICPDTIVVQVFTIIQQTILIQVFAQIGALRPAQVFQELRTSFFGIHLRSGSATCFYLLGSYWPIPFQNFRPALRFPGCLQK